MPIRGDQFIPRLAYKALLKIALSLLPEDEIENFGQAIDSLALRDEMPYPSPLQVGFSYAYVGNAPPALAGCLLRRKEEIDRLPYMLFLFMAGSVCFQIWVRSDGKDNNVPKDVRLGLNWTASFPKQEGGYFRISYKNPITFDWSSLTPTLQPFEAFELEFNPQTTEGILRPIERQ